MPTLVTAYSSGNGQMGKIELESFIATHGGRAGMMVDDDVLDVSNGDFKFNLKLTRDGKQGHDDAEPHFVDVQLKIQTDTAILPMGNHFYKIVGTGTFLYVPNTFYAFDEDSKRMKVQTMEDSYPKLSQLDDDGNQYFTFRFINASEIFYDPDILQMLRSFLSSWVFRNPSSEGTTEEPPEPPLLPYFKTNSRVERTFERDEWDLVGSDIGSFLTSALSAVSGDVTGIINAVSKLVSGGYTKTSSSKKMQRVWWQTSNPSDERYPCLVAIKSEEVETMNNIRVTKMFRKSSSAKSASAQVICIHAGNGVAYQELIGLRNNFTSIANYHYQNFEKETVDITNERGNND